MGQEGGGQMKGEAWWIEALWEGGRGGEGSEGTGAGESRALQQSRYRCRGARASLTAMGFLPRPVVPSNLAMLASRSPSSVKRTKP